MVSGGNDPRNRGADRHVGDDTVIALVAHKLAVVDRERAEAHVASCAACRRLVSAAVRGEVVTPAPRQPMDTPTGTQVRAPRTSVRRLISHGLPVGELFGRYRIERELGVGGMGRVYAAFDPALERRVALKVLHDLGDDTSARLLREARAMAESVLDDARRAAAE